MNIVFVDEVEMATLNMQFLLHQGTTDVITFEYEEESSHHLGEKDNLGGEIIVCATVALKAAKEYETNPGEEIILYIIHGILHLFGFNDKEKEDAYLMRQEEKKLLTLVKGKYPTGHLFFFPNCIR